MAVASELKQLAPDAKLIYIGERGGKFGHLVSDSGLFDAIHLIHAGKFRRYHNESWIRRISDLKTWSLNLRDLGRAVTGFGQSYRLLGRLRPDVVLAKGGFVCVPVGLAAWRRGISLITHDSDTLPGLANRIISRYARINATGMPEQFYSYPKAKLRYTGIPLVKDYQLVTPALQAQYRQELGLPLNAKVLFVTGGSLGAQRLNHALASALLAVMQAVPDLYVLHQTGKGKALGPNGIKGDRYQTFEYVKTMWQFSGGADLVLTQASATTLAELAQQGRAAVLLPSPHLAGGHQITNARYLADNQAAAVIYEDELSESKSKLADVLTKFLNDDQARMQLGQNLHKTLKSNASHELAKLILETVGGGKE